MIDSPSVSEKRLETAQHGIPILSNRDHHMGTECVQAGGNGPNVKIMTPFHSRHADYGLPGLFGVQISWLPILP